MAREILINSAPFETRVALLEKQRLIEIFIERARDRGVAGNIYKGRVTRVLPGMQAAFVDIGLEKAAFLHVSDLDPDLGGEFLSDEGGGPLDLHPADSVDGEKSRRAPIEERLKKGQEVIVQVAKEPIGSKGARVTGVVSLPGRYLVFTPSSHHIGVSRRIENEEERSRLKEIVAAERPPEGGFIIRTACEGLTKREIQGDIRFLVRLWNRVVTKADITGAPALLHYDMDLVLRTVRDLFTTETQRLVVDNRRDFARIEEFVETVMPRLKARIELHEEAEPLFDKFGVEAQINRALERKVWLKSGGYLVIDPTEALTVIDVNTGRYVGKRSQDETILKTNLEAVKTIVEQLRLRNIGGLIVLDLIDMENPAHQREVFESLRDALKKDKARSRLLPISELGLIEMTRKRSRESLAQLLCAPCSTCDAIASAKSTTTVAYEVLRRIQREAARNPSLSQITVHAHPDVAHYIHTNEEKTIEGLETEFAVKLLVKAAQGLAPTQYEVTGVEAAA